MKKIVIFVLVVFIFFSGCTKQDQSNDSGLQAVASYPTGGIGPTDPINIDIKLKNLFNEQTVSNVEVFVKDKGGLEIEGTNCYDNNQINSENKIGCTINSIDPQKEVKVTFNTKSPIGWNTNYNPMFEVSYDSSCSSTWQMTIVKSGEENVPVKSSFTSCQGPIQTKIDRSLKHDEDGSKITMGDDFDISIDVTDVTGNTGSKISNFKVKLTSIQVSGHGTCDFKQDGNQLSIDDFTLPLEKPLKCTFKSSDSISNSGWENGAIETNFDYKHNIRINAPIVVDSN